MDLYVCNECEFKFEKPKKIDLDVFYGISNEFGHSSNQKIEVCPICESNDIEGQMDLFDYVEDEED